MVCVCVGLCVFEVCGVLSSVLCMCCVGDVLFVYVLLSGSVVVQVCGCFTCDFGVLFVLMSS